MKTCNLTLKIQYIHTQPISSRFTGNKGKLCIDRETQFKLLMINETISNQYFM